MMRHEGRVAIVTGAAQGIGFAVATRLLAEGARVVLADVQEDKVRRAAGALANHGQHVLSCTVNVAQSESIRRLVEQSMDIFGRIDIVANVAGGSGSTIIEDIEDMTDDIWDGVLSSNLRGTFLMCRATVPHMRRLGGGAIVNFATGSIRGFTGKTTSAARLAYVAAKAGIIGFTNQLSQDVAPAGIGVNAIQPGFVLTEPGARIRDIFDSMSPEDQQAMLNRRKPRTADEIAWAVAWMVARSQSQLSGVSVRLQGPIDGPNLRLKMDEPNPLATTGLLERM